MRTRPSISSELLPGTLELLILKTLSRKPLYGYGIARRLAEETAGFTRLATAIFAVLDTH